DAISYFPEAPYSESPRHNWPRLKGRDQVGVVAGARTIFWVVLSRMGAQLVAFSAARQCWQPGTDNFEARGFIAGQKSIQQSSGERWSKMARKDAMMNLRQILMRRRDALRQALAGDLSLLKELRQQNSGDVIDAALDTAQD